MPKAKTHKGAAKRFKASANGYKRNKSHRRHILTKKSAKRKRHLRDTTAVCAADVRQVRGMLQD